MSEGMIGFGTDGIRGIYAPGPMNVNEQLGMHLGLATGTKFGAENDVVLVGEDPRWSSEALADAAAAGVAAAGRNVRRVGVVPSPCLAYMVSMSEAVAGIMITASHNEDLRENGLKVFGPDGAKLSDADEQHLEQLLHTAKPHADIHGTVVEDTSRVQNYVQFLRETAGPAHCTTFNGARFVMDFANGAASYIGPELFMRMGAEVLATNHTPDGRNINQDCGAASSEGLLRLGDLVEGAKADGGIAFDGDADRVVIVDEQGWQLDGDDFLYILAHNPERKPTGVVTTIMGNLGLKRALRDIDVDVHRSDVGDRQVSKMLREKGLFLGGEPSGHIITGHLPTGDGMLTAIQVMKQVRASGKSLLEWRRQLEKYRLPEDSLKLTVPDSSKANHPQVRAYVDAVNAAHGDKGVVIVRPSGTEPNILRLNAQGTLVEEFSKIRDNVLGLMAAV